MAFANARGGTIFVGVEENKTIKNQIANIIGCQISDENKQSFISMSASCRPVININISVENSKTKKPIYRIDIPEGDKKPYCTSSGLYKIRDDGQNIGIDPPFMKAIILESSSDEFVKQFKYAADELLKKLESMQNELEDQISRVESAAHEAIDAAHDAEQAAYDAAQDYQ